MHCKQACKQPFFFIFPQKSCPKPPNNETEFLTEFSSIYDRFLPKNVEEIFPKQNFSQIGQIFTKQCSRILPKYDRILPNRTILKWADHALFKFVRFVLL
jgi:hypothetical protein